MSTLMDLTNNRNITDNLSQVDTQLSKQSSVLQNLVYNTNRLGNENLKKYYQLQDTADKQNIFNLITQDIRTNNIPLAKKLTPLLKGATPVYIGLNPGKVPTFDVNNMSEATTETATATATAAAPTTVQPPPSLSTPTETVAPVPVTASNENAPIQSTETTQELNVPAVLPSTENDTSVFEDIANVSSKIFNNIFSFFSTTLNENNVDNTPTFTRAATTETLPTMPALTPEPAPASAPIPAPTPQSQGQTAGGKYTRKKVSLENSLKLPHLLLQENVRNNYKHNRGRMRKTTVKNNKNGKTK